MAKSVRVVSCTKEKVWDSAPDAGPTQASAAYTNWRFPAWRAWASEGRDGWLVLSTHLGLISPGALIDGPYDVAIGERRGDGRFAEILRAQALALGMGPGDELIVADWERAAGVLADALSGTGVVVSVRQVT